MPKYYQFFILGREKQNLMAWGSTVARSYQNALKTMQYFGVLKENLDQYQIVYTETSLFHQLAVLLIPWYKRPVKTKVADE